ncbi:immunoglobulin domain-containing protein [Chitinophaga nivalis]|uniref:Ig-like domain-containing protein n=1 Tax=Chitinophaga nivalis TaxID=2991709 RepID=A0ABT3IJ02_9BACT|nr:hypothetical protein [Chitinophaga nivalis]MCW3466391.1 hypothetical protein [Chitinophaga nivalis]MCW3483918.1 hypothetical protein [Chitinophaga nivalis]
MYFTFTRKVSFQYLYRLLSLCSVLLLFGSITRSQPVHCVRATSASVSGPTAITNPQLAVDNDLSTGASFLFKSANAGAKLILTFPESSHPGDSLFIIIGSGGAASSYFVEAHIFIYDGDTERENLLITGFNRFDGDAYTIYRRQFPESFNKVIIALGPYPYIDKLISIKAAYFSRAFPTVSTPDKLCEGTNTTLHAIAPAQSVFKWYTVPTGGIPLYTGADFTTPELLGNTTYYAETTDATNGCATDTRTKVDITVSPTAGTFTKSWNKTYGGSGLDDLYHVSLATDVGYLLCGTSTSQNGDVTDGNSGQQDFLVVKTDSTGTKKWNKTYGGSDNDVLHAAVKAPGNGFLLTGYTLSADKDVTDGNNGGEDAWIVRVDNTGNKLWDKTFGGTGNDRINAVVASPEGGYLLGGTTWSTNGDVTDGNNGKSDIWIVRLGTGGVKLWDKTFGGNDVDVLTSIAATPDSGYLLGGYTRSLNGDITDGNNGAEDYWIIKIDANGNKQWNKTFGGGAADILKRVLYTEDGGYLLAGTSRSVDGDVTTGNKGLEDFWVVKTDAQGNKEWEKSYGGSSYDILTTVQSVKGGWLLGGYTRSADGDIKTGNKGEDDFLVLLISYTGRLGSSYTLGGSKADLLYSLRTTTVPGELILGGFSYSTDGDISDGNNGLEDFLLLKVAAAYNCEGAGKPATTTVPANSTPMPLP